MVVMYLLLTFRLKKPTIDNYLLRLINKLINRMVSVSSSYGKFCGKHLIGNVKY